MHVLGSRSRSALRPEPLPSVSRCLACRQQVGQQKRPWIGHLSHLSHLSHLFLKLLEKR